MTEIPQIPNKKGLRQQTSLRKLPITIMPNFTEELKSFPTVLVDWKQRDQFLSLIGNTDPVYAIFPKDKRKPCIHIKGKNSEQQIEKHLKRNKDVSLGVILGVAKPQPDDWGTKPEHINKAGYIRAWGASDAHIDYHNVFFAEGDPANMDPDEQVRLLHKAGLPAPSFTVYSGNKSVHPYWKINKCPADKWKNIQKRIIQLLKDKAPKLEVDENIKNPARVMRLAGGRHGKTKNLCEFRSIADHTYSWENFDNYLPELKEKNTPIYKEKKFSSDKGWLDRLKDKPEERRNHVIDMFKVLPIHEGTGQGRRGKICIPCLAGLVNEYGNEAISITNEAGWYGEEWDPAKEIPYLQDHQDCDLGTVVHWAREYGWIHPYDRPKGPKVINKNIKVDEVFPAEVSNSIQTVTTYLPYKDTLKILTFLHAVAPLVRLGTKIICNPYSDFAIPLNLYGCVIGESGSKKTPLFKLLLESPLSEVRKEIAKENFIAGQEYARDLAAYAKDKEGDKPERPAYPIVFTKDATKEALEKQLMDQEKSKLGLLRFNDELAGLIKSFGAYKQGKGGDEEFLLELYDGSGFHSARMEENRYCEETAVSILGGGQPEVLKKLQQGQDHNGKWARFVMDYCKAIPTKLATSGTAEERSKFNKAKSYLSFFITEVRSFRTNDLELSDEALERFADFEFSQQELSAQSSVKPAHKFIYNKSAGKVGRVAGLLHIIEKVQEKIKNKISQGDSYVDLPPDNIVQLGTVNKAINLVNYWDDVSIDTANKSTENSTDAMLKRLLTIAAKSKVPVPFTDIKAGLAFDHRLKYTTEEIFQLIQKLEDLDLGTISTGPRGGKRFKAEKPWPQ